WPSGPEGPDKRQACRPRPDLAKVDFLELLNPLRPRGRLQQSAVADDEGCVSPRQHVVEVGRKALESRLNVPDTCTQHSDECNRRPRARVEGDRSQVRDRATGKQGDRRHGTARADGELGDDAVITAQVLDRRDQTHVDRAGVQMISAAGRYVEPQREPGRAVEAVDEWSRVEIADGAERYQTWRRCHRMIESNRPSRSAGSCPATLIFRHTSSTGARRLPSVSSSTGDTASTSSAPTVRAT